MTSLKPKHLSKISLGSSMSGQSVLSPQSGISVQYTSFAYNTFFFSFSFCFFLQPPYSSPDSLFCVLLAFALPLPFPVGLGGSSVSLESGDDSGSGYGAEAERRL